MTAFDNKTPIKEKKKRKDAATRGTAGQPLADARAVASDLSGNKGNENPLDIQGEQSFLWGPNAQTALARIPLHEKTGEPMFEAVDKDLAWDGLVEAAGSETDAADIARKQMEQAGKELEALKKKPPTMKAPQLKGSAMTMVKAKQDARARYDKEVEEHKRLLAEAQARAEAWASILGVYDARKRAMHETEESGGGGEVLPGPQAAETGGGAVAAGEEARGGGRDRATEHHQDGSLSEGSSRGRGAAGTTGRLGGETSGDRTEREIIRSDEHDDNGLSLLISSDGTTVFGYIRKGEGIKSLPIKLSEGFNKKDSEGNNIGYGFEHIEAGHADEIRNAGFQSVIDFVEFVSKRYQRILVGNKRKNGTQTYLIELKDGKSNTLFIELSKDGQYWTVNSGGVFREGYTKNKETIEPLPAVEASPVAADEKVQEQSDNPMSGNSSSTESFGGKDNAFSGEKQAEGAESSEGTPIAGLEGYSRKEITDIVRREVEEILSDADIDAEIVGLEIHGSRQRGDARPDSDLDIVLEYRGDEKERAMFNAINESPIEIEGITVDVNPIRREETGTLAEYMEKSRAYDAEKKKQTTCPVCGKAHIPNWVEADVVCPQCNSDLSVFRQISQLSGEEAAQTLANIQRMEVEAGGAKGQKQFNRTVPTTTQEQKGAIARIVDFAKRVKNRVERAVIAGITERQKRDFEEQGIDGIDGTWVHSFESSAVSHNQSHHGNTKVEEKIGQIAITPDDYARIPEILESYDRVSKSPNRSRSTGNEVIIYEKDFEDGYIYYLEEKRDKRKSLSFQTMYKKKKGTDSSDGLMPAASSSTPVAPSDNLSSNSDGKVNVLPSDKQNTEAESSTEYTITPDKYTNRKGKTSDVWHVRFNRELTAEEKAAMKAYIEEPLEEGRKISRGWHDRKAGAYIMRSEEAARGLGNLIGNEEAVADAQPLTADDYAAASEATTVQTPETKKKREPKKPAPANRVSVEALFDDLNTRGETRLSDHAEAISDGDNRTGAAAAARDHASSGGEKPGAEAPAQDQATASSGDRPAAAAARERISAGSTGKDGENPANNPEGDGQKKSLI